MIKHLLNLLVLASALGACQHCKRTVCIKAKDPWVRSYCAERPCPCSCENCCEQRGYPEAGCCYD